MDWAAVHTLLRTQHFLLLWQTLWLRDDSAPVYVLCDGDDEDEGRCFNACHNHQVVFCTQRRPGIPVESTRMSDTCIRGHFSQQLHLALAGLALAAVDSARHLARLALELAVFARNLVVFARDLVVFAHDLVVFVLDLAGSALVASDIAGV